MRKGDYTTSKEISAIIGLGHKTIELYFNHYSLTKYYDPLNKRILLTQGCVDNFYLYLVKKKRYDQAKTWNKSYPISDNLKKKIRYSTMYEAELKNEEE